MNRKRPQCGEQEKSIKNSSLKIEMNNFCTGKSWLWFTNQHHQIGQNRGPGIFYAAKPEISGPEPGPDKNQEKIPGFGLT